MKKSLKLIISVLLVSVLSLGLFAGCDQSTGTSNDADEPKGTIKIGYVNWAEGIAITNLAKAVLEDKMGYEVEITMADVAPVFTSVASGKHDAFMDAWLPVTHESNMNEYGDKLVDLGYNFEGARIGLVVPEYVTINSIEELNDSKDKFNGEIIGIDSGAGIMNATESAIQEYELDLKLQTGSGPVMTAALKKAIDKGEWIAVTGWDPHWKFARWDLKFLEDPKGVYGAVENIHTVARKDLEQDMPDVAQFFRNFKMDSQNLGDLMGAIADSDEDPIVPATQWMNDNEDLVNNWIPGN